MSVINGIFPELNTSQMQVFGFICAVFMGVTLGIIGAGGSILTVPILVYLLHITPVLATSYSLFIVGITSLFGAFGYMKNNLINYRTAVVFGIPALIGVFSVRYYLLPIIPDSLFVIGEFKATKDIGILFLFAVLMIASAIPMIIKPNATPKDNFTSIYQYRYLLIFFEGLLIGGITGLVGAGGGFLIIPALVILAGEGMKRAIGTSLLIIGIKSLTGFYGDLIVDMPIDWPFLFIFSAFSILGILAGTYLSKYYSGEKLKPVFGWFVLVIGIYIIAVEFLKCK